MRTKTILTAAMGVLGAASVIAVTSVNVVGYVNVPCKAGFNLLAPPLKAATQRVADILPSVPEGATLQKWNTGLQAFDSAIAFDTVFYGGWENPDLLIDPGEAVFLNIPADDTVTFVGDVRETHLGTLTATPTFVGFSFVGSQVAQAGLITTTLGLIPGEGDQCQQWDPVGQAFLSAVTYDTVFYGGWETEPNLAMAEGVVLTGSAPGSWTRTFDVQ